MFLLFCVVNYNSVMIMQCIIVYNNAYNKYIFNIIIITIFVYLLFYYNLQWLYHSSWLLSFKYN
jgi:hypothetical protein